MAKTEIDIREVVRAHIKKVYGTQRHAAEHWGKSQAYISAVLSGEKMMPDYMANDAGYQLVQREAMWVKLKKS